MHQRCPFQKQKPGSLTPSDAPHFKATPLSCQEFLTPPSCSICYPAHSMRLISSLLKMPLSRSPRISFPCWPFLTPPAFDSRFLPPGETFPSLGFGDTALRAPYLCPSLPLSFAGSFSVGFLIIDAFFFHLYVLPENLSLNTSIR